MRSGVGIALRAAAYATVFVSVVFVFVPWLVLSRSGTAWPKASGVPQQVGAALVAAGAAVSLWCAAGFVTEGRGTPAPFDAPRRLVVRGPYRVVRNPMYAGAGIALLGSALFYGSASLAIYWAVLWGASHLFVTRYEEPTLRRTFGEEYDDYCARVGRWWPRSRSQNPRPTEEPR